RNRNVQHDRAIGLGFEAPAASPGLNPVALVHLRDAHERGVPAQRLGHGGVVHRLRFGSLSPAPVVGLDPEAARRAIPPVLCVEADAVAGRLAAAVEKVGHVERILQPEPRETPPLLPGRSLSQGDHDVRPLLRKQAWQAGCASIRAGARCPVTERRGRLRGLRARQPPLPVTPVVPAFRPPASLERAVDDGAEQPVVVPPLDQERDLHRAPRATAAATHRRTISSATRSVPRPSTRRRPSPLILRRSAESVARRRTAPSSEGSALTMSPARLSASTLARWLSARHTPTAGTPVARHS